MKNNTNQIMKLNIPIWIKYWLSKHKNASYILSEILTGTEFFLQDSAPKKFKIFDIIGRTTQESTTGKQLFDKNTNVTGISRITSYTYNNGIYTIIPTGTGNPQFKLNFVIPAGSYTLNSDAYLSIATILRNANGTLKNFGSNYVNQNFTTTEASTELVFNWANPENTNPITLDLRSLMINTGSTAEPYEPYTGGEPAPNPKYPYAIKNTGDNGSVNEKVSNSDGTQEQNILFPLAEGQKLMQGDYLADDGIHHVMREITINGSESGWTKYNDEEYYTRGVLSDSKANTQAIQGFCNRIKSSSGVLPFSYISKVNVNLGIDIRLAQTYWGFTGSTVEEFKAWLAENPIILQYKLETEVIDPYTEEQQQYYDEHIKPLRTYKNVTHISSEDETPANLKIQYYKEG